MYKCFAYVRICVSVCELKCVVLCCVVGVLRSNVVCACTSICVCMLCCVLLCAGGVGGVRCEESFSPPCKQSTKLSWLPFR